MSAAMLIATLSTPLNTPIDFDSGRAAVAALRDTDDFSFDDPAFDIERVLANDDSDDLGALTTMNGDATITGAKRFAEVVIDTLEEIIDSSNVNMLTVAGRHLYVTGDLSWGDTPTDAATVFWDLDRLPASVLQAMNIIVTAEADPVLIAMNKAADAVIALTPNDDKLRDGVNLVVNASLHFLEAPKASLSDAVTAQYDEDPDEVLSWVGED